MIPGCISASRSTQNSTEEISKQTKSIVQIYIDWANHYLDKARSKRRIHCLVTDCRDGVLLAEIIECVVGQRIEDINKKPKTSSQMLQNLNVCLSALLNQHVPGIETIHAQEIIDGKLKPILSLFFALSRYKQVAKQGIQQADQFRPEDGTPNRSPQYHHPKGNSSIPLPDSSATTKRCLPDKSQPVTSISRTSSPTLSMIPRAPTCQQLANLQTSDLEQRPSVLTKPKLFKTNEKFLTTSTSQRTNGDNYSGTDSKKLNRVESSRSYSVEELKYQSGAVCKVKETRSTRVIPNLSKSNSTAKKVIKTNYKVPSDVNPAGASSTLSKLSESKTKLRNSKKISADKKPIVPNCIPSQTLTLNTGIPKPVATVKGTSKIIDENKSVPSKPFSDYVKDDSQRPKPLVVLVSPIKNKTKENVLPSDSITPSPVNDSGNSFNDGTCKRLDAPGNVHNTTWNGKLLNQRINPTSNFLMPKENTTENISSENESNSSYTEHINKMVLKNNDGISKFKHGACNVGYLSEGEVLSISSSKEMSDGYASEGGAMFFRNTQQMNRRLRPNLSFTVLTEDVSKRGCVEEPPPSPSSRINSRSPRRNANLQGNKHGQWKKYTDSPGVGSPPPPATVPVPSSPTSIRKDRRNNTHISNNKEKTSRVKGIPQSFGSTKKSTGTCTNGTGVLSNGTIMQVQSHPDKSASSGPRTKVKVSGGTQTYSADLQQSFKTNPSQFKSFSLSGHAANQLSQSVRERLMMGSQSLPKNVSQEYGFILRQSRPKTSDGSLSDTQAVENLSPYAPWLRHSNTYSIAPRLSETDSMESLTSLPSHRSSLTNTRLLRDSPSRLSRSNSIRSTKSEKLYPSMLHRNVEAENEPYYCLPVGALNHWSQPASPAPGSNRNFPLSPTHSSVCRSNMSKNDEVHGSSISLISTTSSLYSSAEEKQAHEIRKLRRELNEAQDKVQTLTSQLSTNAHVVSAFEQSLTSMTQRLQHLTATAEKKDTELAELKNAMEALRTQSVQAGITTGLTRQPSSDSVSSLSSACSLDKHDKKKKKGWLRSSFTKAFSRNAKVTKVHCQSESESDRQYSPPQTFHIDHGQEVAELQKQLREKDLVLTDIRLEALSSAHQLESLRDTVMKMRNEMLSLKENNERLQRMVGNSGNFSNELKDSQSQENVDALNDLISADEPPSEIEHDGKEISISIYLGQPQNFKRYYSEHYSYDGTGNAFAEIAIARTLIAASTSWSQLDHTVRRTFKQHVSKLDPGGCLGLGSDAIASYKLGEAERKPDSKPPDLLPIGYSVGRVSTLHVVLQPIAALAFEALIPKGVAQRLVSLLAEHKRLVLCGAPGTGKTHLATRLAEFYVQSQGRDPAEAVATFSVDNKSNKELRQYLSHLSEQAATGDNSVLPCVVVLDDLHKAGPLSDALGSLPRNLPCLVGTMAQSACSATNLQLQHGFRWVLVAPHMEPARGLLGRVLRRRLATLELEQGPQPELAAILGWLPRIWQHLNAFLETHSSGDVVIGPRLFLSCPLEIDAARAWFADIWNYSLAPYLREAVREGLQLYGRRAPWIDPCQFILDTYPWPGAPPQGLTTISAKDVGLESSGNTSQPEYDGDPLLNMLMRLQEAANYSSPHSNDSDCNSLDSSLKHESNINAERVS